MCGITGFIDGNGVSPARARERLQAMTDALEHRGPDGAGHWGDEPAAGVWLGHRRLSIIDIGGGAQPMSSRDGRLVITFNGEIYNHEELRRELAAKGHVFQSDHSDTEVLIYGYREWGADLPQHLNGMWAFAIYDAPRRRLFCSRDRFGKKPFYYSIQNGVFAFASELSAFIGHPAIARNISALALKKYFAYGYIPAPHSIYENIHKLPGGHSLFVDATNLSTRLIQYWDFVLEPFSRDEIPKNPEAEWGEQLRELLDRAVRRRLMSDVPLGVFLSGGVDSSAVTAFAARHVASGGLSTFSIGFEEASFDESQYARRIAELFQTRHHEETLSIDRARQVLPEITALLDEPMGDASLLPMYLLARFTRRSVTVALGGDGSDELFAGYDPFRALGYAQMYAKLIPRPIHEGIRMFMARLPVSHRNMSADFRVKRTLQGLSYAESCWIPAWMAPVEPRDLAELFDEQSRSDSNHNRNQAEAIYSEAIEQWESCATREPVDRAMQFYTKIYLQDDILVKADRASMMVSLEVRCPFLDVELVDFVRRIPARYKFRNGQTKYILKRALESVLPHEILHRAKKGFGVPIGQWFRDGELRVDASLTPSGINRAAVERRAGIHAANQTDDRAFLWNHWLYTQMLRLNTTPATVH